MASLYVFSECSGVDHAFVSVVARVMNEDDICVLDTWMGLDKATFEMVEGPTPFPRVAIETSTGTGRFGLCVSISGRGVRSDLTPADLTRRLAVQLGSTLLHSDCSPSGVTWFMFAPSGDIYHVTTTIEPTDNYDLIDDPVLVWRADEPLPPPPPDAQKDEATPRVCGLDSAKLCVTFGIRACSWSRRPS